MKQRKRDQRSCWSPQVSFGRYVLRDRARGAPINHSGFVSNLNASMKKSQARVLPGGRTQLDANAGLACSIDVLLPRVPRGGNQACGVLSMQASLQRGDVPGYLRIGKSRKRGLGVRGSLPMVQHNRGVYDPGWTTSNFTGRDWRMVSFCCVRRLLSQILQSFECL